MAHNQIYFGIPPEVPLTSVERKKLDPLFAQYCGIINATMERNELSAYGFHMYQSLAAKTSVLGNVSRDISSGGLGISTDRYRAFMAALGESLERYVLPFAHGDDLFCSYEDLPKRFTSSGLPSYLTQGFTKRIDFLKQRLHWVKVSGVTNGRSVYWPARLIFLPYEKEVGEIGTSSTGVATHETVARAVASGVLETIERDALMTNFFYRMPVFELEFTNTDQMRLPLLRKVKRNYNSRTLLLTTDHGVPVFLSLIWKNRGDFFHFGIGASADLDSDIAIEKSLKECLFTYRYSLTMMGFRKKDKTEITTLYEHFLYYQDRDNFKTLFPDRSKKPYARTQRRFAAILTGLARSGFDVFSVDLTTPDIRYAGKVVVRVVIPNMIDLPKKFGELMLPDLKKRKGLARFASRRSLEMPHPFP